MINLSIQNFTPSCPALIPLEMRFFFFFKGTTEARQDPTGPCQVQNSPFELSPISELQGGKGSLALLEFQRAGPSG